MNVLLDTCTFLWYTLNDANLSSRAHKAITNADTVYLSSLTSAEIALKYSMGKLTLPSEPSLFMRQERMEHDMSTLPLTERHTLALEWLEQHHNDPFDRLLVCQSIVEGLPIVTSDPMIHAYDTEVIW